MQLVRYVYESKSRVKIPGPILSKETFPSFSLLLKEKAKCRKENVEPGKIL